MTGKYVIVLNGDSWIVLKGTTIIGHYETKAQAQDAIAAIAELED